MLTSNYKNTQKHIAQFSTLTTGSLLLDGDVCFGPALFEFPLTVVGVCLPVLSTQGLVCAVTLYGLAGTPKLSVFQQTHGVELTTIWAAAWRPETHVYMRQQCEERQ